MKNRALYGLLGKSISHSFSPDYFNNKFLREKIDAEFVLFDIQSIDELPGLLKKNPGLKGFSVTIPYKQAVLGYLNDISPEAREIGAVNCVKVSESGLEGYNTDVIGFKKSLEPLIEGETDLKALILGTGGAAKAVAFVLTALGISFDFVSRRGNNQALSYNALGKTIVESSRLIINTTPAGMFPMVDAAPAIPYQYLTKHHLLYDLIYNPEETLFLKKGRRKGAVTKNGLEMLHLQAEAAWEIWQRKF